MSENAASVSAKVDFYLLDSNQRHHLLRFACRLTDKVFSLGKRIWLRAENEDEAALLDDLLWTFSDVSFIPHCRLCTAASAASAVVDSAADGNAVLISAAADARAPKAAEVLINLAPVMPDAATDWTRIAEIVGADEAQRANARRRFKLYRDQGMDLHSHFIQNLNS